MGWIVGVVRAHAIHRRSGRIVWRVMRQLGSRRLLLLLLLLIQGDRLQINTMMRLGRIVLRQIRGGRLQIQMIVAEMLRRLNENRIVAGIRVSIVLVGRLTG